MSEMTASASVARAGQVLALHAPGEHGLPLHRPATLVTVLRLRVALVVVVFVACAVIALLLRPTAPTRTCRRSRRRPGAERGEAVADPFAWTPERSAELTERAAAGTAHLLYTRSPGGVAVTAERVAALPRRRSSAPRRPRAWTRTGSRRWSSSRAPGRPDALAPGGIEGAAGLTQILAETATALLGDEGRPRAQRAATRAGWTGRCARATCARAAALNRARRRVDDRFDPAKALAGTARYLKLARERFGREDLAFVSYHMGMGNLESVLKALRRRAAAPTPSSTSTPRRCATRRPTRGSRPSATTPRTTTGSSARRSRSCGWRARTRRGWAGSRRCRPPTTPPAACCSTARRRAICATLPDRPRRHGAGARARACELRPEALGVALYMAAEVRAISDAPALRVTGADDGGWTFRVSRELRLGATRRSRSSTFSIACRCST